MNAKDTIRTLAKINDWELQVSKLSAADRIGLDPELFNLYRKRHVTVYFDKDERVADVFVNGEHSGTTLATAERALQARP